MSWPLPPPPTITTASEAIYKDKGDGTEVRYYLAAVEYEIHANRLAPGTVQGWHVHKRITEALYVTAGVIEARWTSGGEVVTRRLERGDMIDVGASLHTIANPFADPAEFVVFRFVPDGIDKRELIRTDRHAAPDPESK